VNASLALADSRTAGNFRIADTVGELISALSALDPATPAPQSLIDQASALLLPPSEITLFAESYPRAVDIDQGKYEANKADYDAAALASGYRLAGHRLQRAVFTTKT
jgi:hypothetical protein